MVVLIFLLIVILSSASSLRMRRKRILKFQELTLAPKVFVQPAQSNSMRKFCDGRVTLMNLQSQGTLMLVEEGLQMPASFSTYLLKSDLPFHFNSTLLMLSENSRMEIHASLKGSREVIVFQKKDREPAQTFSGHRSAL